jgi:hypothetical protein
MISCLEKGDEMLVETNDMLEHAQEFYKTLFGKETKSHVRLEENFWEEEESL